MPRVAWVGMLNGLLAAAPTAHADTPADELIAQLPSVEVRSRTGYYAYPLRLQSDPEFRAYRNINLFYEWLDVRADHLGPAGVASAAVSLRYNTDFGTGFHRDTPDSAGIPAVDRRNDLDLSYAYVDWRDAIPGWLDLRLGRQLIVDDLAWYSFDGIRATLHPARHANVTVYLGTPVPFGKPLSSGSFLPNDGIEVSEGTRLVFGGDAYWQPLPALELGLAFRHELIFRSEDFEAFGVPADSPTAALVRAISGGTSGLQEQLLGGSAAYDLRKLHVDLFAHLIWNLLFGHLDQLRVGAGWTPGAHLRAEIEYFKVRPSFVADSIFNLFNIFPYDRVRTALAWQPLRHWRVEAAYFYEQVNGGPLGPLSSETAGNTDPNIRGGEGSTYAGSDVIHGPSVEIEYRAGIIGLGLFGQVSTNTSGDYAYGGNYRLGEVYGDLAWFEGRLLTSLRLNYTGSQYDWIADIDAGKVQAERSSESIRILALATITSQVRARLDLTRTFGSFIEGNFRIFSGLEVTY